MADKTTPPTPGASKTLPQAGSGNTTDKPQGQGSAQSRPSRIEAARTDLRNAARLIAPSGILSPDQEAALNNAMANYERALGGAAQGLGKKDEKNPPNATGNVGNTAPTGDNAATDDTSTGK